MSTTPTKENRIATPSTPAGMEKRCTLELTEIECNQLAQLIDVAVRADGMRAAAVGLPMFDKIRKAVESAIVVPIGGGRIVS